MRNVMIVTIVLMLVVMPGVLFSQSPGNFPTSLHGTRAGKAWWYSKDNGGFETLTNIPMSDLPCQKCHAATYASGDSVDAATYQPDCKDCHDFTQGNTVRQETCLGCHSRQGLEIKLSQSNPIFSDVHRDKGFTCTSCHTKKETHGDGNSYNAMHQAGATDVTCETCHDPAQIPGNTAHALHMNEVDCAACHSQTIVACNNCHFETEVQAHQKRFYGPPPALGFVMLARRPGGGKVTTASFQSLVYQGKSFYAIGRFNGHTISKEARDCSECHNSQNVQAYNQTGKITVTHWDSLQKKIVNTQGVIPVPPDWQQALEFDFVDYTGDVNDPTKPFDPTKWEFLKSGADLSQMLFAEPLTAEQMQKLSVDIRSDFSTSLHGTRQGKATWYSKDNGGFESLTNIPMSDLPCQKCHAATYANGDPVDAATYQPDCKDCHDFTQGNTVKQETCLGCHSRQGAEIGMSANNPMFSDVHREKGFTCTSCHTKKEMHGDGNSYTSMLEPGATEASCENEGCHPASELASTQAHDIHSGKVYCNACHAQTIVSCYNCHFESEVQAHQKRFYGPPPIGGFAMLVNSEKHGMVTTASFQSLKYQDKTFYAIGPFNGHTITREARDCSECHNSPIVQTYNQTGEITVASWDSTEKKIVNTKGVIPVPPDWQQALKFDFVDYTGEVTDPTKPLDPTKWEFLKSGADQSQILFAQPLTAEQMAKLSMPVVSVEEEESSLPREFGLFQNFPNPFNPGTRIAFEIPQPTAVTLKVYNILGVEVKTLLLHRQLEAGVHKVQFDMDGIPSGVYFYQLITPEFRQTRKMTLMR